MKKAYNCCVLFLLSTATFAQVTNYNQNGDKTTPVSERIVVSVDKSGVGRQAATLLGSAISGVLPVVVDLVKAALAKREASFTASYTGSFSDQPFMIDNSKINITSINIKRITKDDDGKETTAADITLSAEQFGAVFRFKVKQVNLTLAKARIRSAGKSGKTVDLNVDVKVDALWNEYDDKGKATLKTGTLGESSITVSGLHPGGSYSDTTNTTSWYQFIPAAPTTASSEVRERGWYNITVTVKEANPYGLTYQKLADFFTNNSSDISGVLKALVPGSSSSSSTGKQ